MAFLFATSSDKPKIATVAALALSLGFPVSTHGFPYAPGTVCNYEHVENVRSPSNFGRRGRIHFSKEGLMLEEDDGIYDDTIFYRCSSDSYMGACTLSEGNSFANSTALTSYPGFLLIGQHFGKNYTMMRLFELNSCRIQGS